MRPRAIGTAGRERRDGLTHRCAAMRFLCLAEIGDMAPKGSFELHAVRGVSDHEQVNEDNALSLALPRSRAIHR